jgi:hypothetical protein
VRGRRTLLPTWRGLRTPAVCRTKLARHAELSRRVCERLSLTSHSHAVLAGCAVSFCCASCTLHQVVEGAVCPCRWMIRNERVHDCLSGLRMFPRMHGAHHVDASVSSERVVSEVQVRLLLTSGPDWLCCAPMHHPYHLPGKVAPAAGSRVLPRLHHAPLLFHMLSTMLVRSATYLHVAR